VAADVAPDRADATLPLPRLWVERPGLLAGAVRGLVVTPWFAAATGLVVAVGLWISAPHAELKFPSAVGAVPCQTPGCGTAVSQGAGKLTTTRGLPIPRSHKAAGEASGSGGGTAASGLTFGYVVLWHQQGAFAVQITVTGKNAPHAWQLAFAMPGDKITYVTGATWLPSGSDRGTASPQPGQPGQWGGSTGERGDRHVISFTVLGQGTPAMPTRCTFNNAACSFA
jgi:hypothetical protein